MNTGPTFVGIGAQKCASSWLHRLAASHPDVGVSQDKELDFFSYRFDHGYQWYEDRFVHCRSRQVRGETSPSYFCDPRVPERLFRYRPAARIVVSLRDPVDRALSNHRHEVRAGHVHGDLSFAKGLENNPMYIEQSRYGTHLGRWLACFPSEQVLVILLDDVVQDPEAVARRLFRFLGVSEAHRSPLLAERANVSHAHRHRGLARLKDGLYAWAEAGAPGQVLWQTARLLGVRAVYRRVNIRPSEAVIPPPKPETLARLREHLAPEVLELSRLIGRPLDAWLPP